MNQLTHGSLFSGIGGFDLGFERAGFKTLWQVEIDVFCRNVLARHFPEAERFTDVREVGAHNLKRVDVISGGFPCQDISDAGEQAGIDGDRSGLWAEYSRIISELRPQFAVVENVAALLDRGMGRVVGDLAEIGYDAEWSVLSACRMGAPHMRERVFIIAYPTRERCLSSRMESSSHPVIGMEEAPEWSTDWLQSHDNRDVILAEKWGPEICGEIKPCFIGMADGLPEWLDRLKSLGNSVMPQVAQLVAERIKALFPLDQ